MQFRIHLSVIGLALALSITGCNLTITPPPQPATNPNGVIFSVEQTQANLDVVWPAPTGVWLPSAADVAKLEAELPAFLQSAESEWLKPDPPIWERVPDYMRQYLGIVENGEEVIYANFFCSIDDMDWHNEFVFVLDGGDCFFSVKYNPQTGEFFDLSVNGEA
jgi:hypothetical protein